MVKVGALAVVKAHPLVFGFFLAAAIGVVVYQIVKSKKQNKHKYSRSSGPDHPSSGGGGTCGEFVGYEELKSTAVPVKSEASENSLRKRHVAQKTSSDVANSKTLSEKKCNSCADNFDNNQNILESKVLSDKNLDNAMTIHEKVNEYLRNISSTELSSEETDSTYSGSNSTNSSDESDSSNDIVKSAKHSTKISSTSSDSSNDIVKPVKYSTEISSTSSDSSSWDHVSLNDVNNLNKKKSRASSISSIVSITSTSSIGTLLSGDSEMCKACKENPVNTSTAPCNHCYMCSDCAFRIFPLFKRCKVCRTVIERIVVQE